MATRQDGAIPDFLKMDDAIGSDPANANKTGNWPVSYTHLTLPTKA